MSDPVRVLFATNNVAGDADDSSKFNGFPFPTPEGVGEDGTSFPIRLPWLTAVACWWKVRNWYGTSDIVGTSGNGFELNMAGLTPINNPAVNELVNITTFGHFCFGGKQDDEIDVPGYGMGASAGIDGSIFSPAKLEIDFLERKFIWPVFSMDFGIGAGPRLFPDGPRATVIRGSTIPEIDPDTGGIAPPDLTVNVNVKLFGGVIVATCTGYVYGVHDADPDLQFLPSGTYVDFSAVNCWAYATSIGAPVYNTTTGVQVNDPTS